MSYVIGNGKYFLTRNCKSQYIPTPDLNDATTFKDKEKVTNTLNNLPKTLKNLNYKAMEIVEESSSEEPKTEKKKFSIKSEYEIKLDSSFPCMEDIIDIASNFEKLFCKIIDHKELLEAQLNLINKSIIDVEHLIEFRNLNACQGYKVYKKLRELRLERRKVKDSLTIVQIFQDFVTDDPAKQEIAKRIEGIQERIYSPRVLVELFKVEGENEDHEA